MDANQKQGSKQGGGELGASSIIVVSYMYWFVHCRFFQPNSETEQHYLLRKVAIIFANFLSLKSLKDHKDEPLQEYYI